MQTKLSRRSPPDRGRSYSAFHRARPLVRIEVREAGPQRQREAILAGELDVGYSALPAPLDEPRLASDPAGSVPFLVALPAGHHLSGAASVTAEQIAGEGLIEYAPGDSSDHEAPDTLRRAGLTSLFSSAGHRADSTLSVLALVAAGVGVAVVPDGVHRAAVPEVVFRPLAAPGLAVDFHLLHRATETNPAVSAFLEQKVETPAV